MSYTGHSQLWEPPWPDCFFSVMCSRPVVVQDWWSSRKHRGLYSSLFQEKPPERKLLFWADFIENWAPFIENSILTIFTDPKAKRSENVLNNQIQSHFNNCGTMKELQHKSFIWLCIWLLGAFSDLLAFGSVKSVKIEFFYKRGLVFYKIS